MHTTQAATTPATPAPRRILAAHLELALVTARMRRRAPHLARFAAMTGYPCYLDHCAPAGLKAWPTPRRPHRGYDQPACLPMDTGDIDLVIERTRLNHGRDEVRRTWGMGIRQLRSINLARPA